MPRRIFFGALGGGGDEDLGRGDDLEAGRVMLADPGLLVAEPVQVLDQFEVAVECFSRILVERMERGEEDAIAHRNGAGHSSGASNGSLVFGCGHRGLQLVPGLS